MNPNDAKPIFSFIPKPYLKEKQEFEEPKEMAFSVDSNSQVGNPLGGNPIYQTQKVELPTYQVQKPLGGNPFTPVQESSQQQSIEMLISKIENLESLLLQKQREAEVQEGLSPNSDEIINHLRANNLQITKLAKEVRQIDNQRNATDASSEIENILGQLRSTNLYLSKVDRKIDYLINAISMMQEKEQMDSGADMSYQPRSQNLLLAKLERKMNELLYHYNQK